MKSIISVLFSSFLFIFYLSAQDFQVVLLPDNQAFIQEQRSFPLQKGRQQILLPDLPNGLDFSSFYIWPMTQGVMLNTMGIKSASMSLGTLLQHNLNKRVSILMPNGQRISGWLIEWFDDGKRLYLKSDQNQPVLVQLQEPYGLFFEQDTVFFQSKDFYKRYFIEVESDGKRQAQFELGYLVDKIYWKVEYMALLNEKEDHCRLMGWLNLDNDCGKDFPQAKVSLLIGGGATNL